MVEWWWLFVAAAGGILFGTMILAAIVGWNIADEKEGIRDA